MNYNDPLVTNGITYAPIHDIVMSDAPIYSQLPYMNSYYKIPPYNNDSFTPKTKKMNPWLKWTLGIAATALAILGIRKYGIKPIISKINKKFNSAVEFCKKHIPFIKK